MQGLSIAHARAPGRRPYLRRQRSPVLLAIHIHIPGDGVCLAATGLSVTKQATIEACSSSSRERAEIWCSQWAGTAGLPPSPLLTCYAVVDQLRPYCGKHLLLRRLGAKHVVERGSKGGVGAGGVAEHDAALLLLLLLPPPTPRQDAEAGAAAGSQLLTLIGGPDSNKDPDRVAAAPADARLFWQQLLILLAASARLATAANQVAAAAAAGIIATARRARLALGSSAAARRRQGPGEA